MKRFLILGLPLGCLLIGLGLSSTAVERRCGWLHNPTPANWWLVDRDGAWIISVQGGYRAPGMENIPDLARGEYVTTNVHYGYACACMDVTADANAMQITNIYSAEQLPLAICHDDPALPPP